MTTTEADGASEEAQELVSALRSAAATEGWAGAQESHIQAADNAQRALLSYIASLEAENERLRSVVKKVPNAAEYVLGTIGVGGAINIDREGDFDVAIHRGRRGSAVRFMEQIRDAARQALDSEGP